ncbi:MAG: hypothetical protein IJN43_12570 [Ruminococcus sp.]|nr:hypothetical protein [Ruminococcus sp.]
MKTPRIINSVGHIDDDLITGATEKKKKAKFSLLLKLGSVAACFAVIVIAGTAFLPSLLKGKEPQGTDGRYKDIYIHTSESAIIWPWEYKTAFEKYTSLTMNDVEYNSKRNAVSESLVGDKIGTYTVTGYDETTDKKYTADAEVYHLLNVTADQFIAVKIEDDYCVFKNNEYNPPDTLGKLFEQAELSKVVELNRFSENDSTPDSKHYLLNDDEYIWEVLSECKEAPFVEDQNWYAGDRSYLSFTITSEVLGVYKVAMYVTEDGYLWTNAFSWQYLFDIGEDAAGKIITYAKENSAETDYESYQNAIVGTITEITDEHILVEDSVLCENPEDGITYRVLLNDLRISRYVEHGIIEVGNNVQITYEGEIYPSNAYYANTINSAVSASKVIISEGDVLIPE